MLTIRMQRLGRKGHPTYRVVVQDVRQTPTSGKYVAMLGSYDPHSKSNTLVKEKAEFYLSNGAQPSDRVVRLFASEGIKLPEWVKQPSQHTRGIRNAEKLRRNQPKEEKPAEEEAPAAEEPAPTGEESTAPEETTAEEATAAAPEAEAPKAETEEQTETSEPATEEAPPKKSK